MLMMPHGARPPIWLAILFPTVVFGVAFLVKLLVTEG